MTEFKGYSANEVYQAIASHFRTTAVARQESRAGQTHELLNAIITITNPTERWVTCRRPALNPAFSIAEVVWILRGRSDLAFLTAWNSRYHEYVGSDPDCHGAYGYRLRSHLGLDQLKRAFEALRGNPDSRQVLLQVWDSRVDLPSSEGDPAAKDIPCNVCAMLKVRDGKLHWLQILRSNDVFLGVPQNFVQWTTLQEVVAGWLNLDVGPYVHVANSLHIYDEHLEDVLGTPQVAGAMNTDSLALPWDESEHWFGVLDNRIEVLGQGGVAEDELLTFINVREMPRAFQNLLHVMGAEYARKRKWQGLTERLISDCSNPALRQMWQTWYKRGASVKGKDK